MSSDTSTYAVGGVTPSSVTLPMNVADLAAVMRRAASDGHSVGVCGGLSKIDQGAAPTSLDVLVGTANMDRIVEHAAGDLVVTAQAGVPLAALQEHLAPARQWLALDPPEPGATVGGVVAAAASGPRRLLYGTPRDLLIGITVVLADGTVAKSGGKVVKNVAGYDLGKLFTGSFGTLGVIAECTFRLHPLAPALRVVTANPDDPAAAARRVFATGAVPSALEWDGTTLVAVFESIESAAEAQASEVAAAIGGEVGDALPVGFGERPTGDVLLKLTHRLGAVREILDIIASRVQSARVRAHVGSGVVWVGASDLAPLDELRGAVAAYDGGVVVVKAPTSAKQGVDVWGPTRGIAVMRRIKDQFDPDGRMSPGRFVGGHLMADDLLTGGFDAHHPPSRDLIADCVHCGFCLPTCPTYQLWGEEMDSPRGRIYLMKQVLDGEPLDATVMTHIDNCLGCMSCVTACPSGVQYDALIESTRGQIERNVDRPKREKALRALIFSLFPYPRRLAALRGPLWTYRRLGISRAVRRSKLLDKLPSAFGAMEDLLPKVSSRQKVPRVTPAVGEQRARVGLLLGCVQREFFPGVNAATARVLAAEGCEVIAPGRTSLLWRTVAAHRPRGRSVAAGAATHRRLRGSGRRGDRDQCRRLWLVDEGLRTAARRRPGVGFPCRGVLGQVPRCE